MNLSLRIAVQEWRARLARFDVKIENPILPGMDISVHDNKYIHVKTYLTGFQHATYLSYYWLIAT